MGLIMDQWKSEKEEESPAQAQRKARSKDSESDPPLSLSKIPAQFEVKSTHLCFSNNPQPWRERQPPSTSPPPPPSSAVRRRFRRFRSHPSRSFCQCRVLPEPPLRLGFPRIMAFSSNDIKVGSNIEVDGAPWRVIEFLHVKPGKGAAFVRTKMRNYASGNTVEKTFRAGSTINEANIYKETKQFVYKDGPQFVFMDLTTYEETRVNESSIGDKTKWLKEGMDCNLLLWNDKLIDVDIPITVQLKVVDVDPGLKGDTAQGGGTKPATLDTGAVVYVPLFVNVGDEILVDTRTGQYMTRAEKN